MNDTDKTKNDPIYNDEGYVSVPLSRYEQLVTAETILAIVQRVCPKVASYQLPDFLKMVLPAGKDAEGEDDA